MVAGQEKCRRRVRAGCTAKKVESVEVVPFSRPLVSLRGFKPPRLGETCAEKALIRRDWAPRSKVSCQPMQPPRGSRCARCSFFLAPPFFVPFSKDAEFLAREVWSRPRVWALPCEREKRAMERESENFFRKRMKPPFLPKKEVLKRIQSCV